MYGRHVVQRPHPLDISMASVEHQHIAQVRVIDNSPNTFVPELRRHAPWLGDLTHELKDPDIDTKLTSFSPICQYISFSDL